jgi:peptide chain release factor 1
MAALARDERDALEATRLEVENAVVRLLVPQEDADERAAILEIRAGTGGLEASLFADDLRGMYERYAAAQGWKFELLGCSKSDVGGIRDCTALLTGVGVFGRLKYEAGVHRVQRVPSTERAGRVHTSTATVAVLPEAEEVDVTIDEKDLKIDVFRSSGAGGQSVNKTESAVRLTHLPTGITISMQDERSQHRNRAKAMQVLKAKLFQAANEAQRLARSADRQAQVGGGDRHERIRTYNFPQGRVTDHRVNVTKFDMDAMMSGGHTLADLIDDLAKFHAVRALSELYGIEVDDPAAERRERERDADD